MSGSTRAPDPALQHPALQHDDGLAEPSGGPGRGDGYVDRLGDRLTASHPPPPIPRGPATLPPASRPVVEASEVRPTPPEDRDDAMDFPPSEPVPHDAFAEFEEDEIVGEQTEIEEGLVSESTQIIDESPPMPVLYVEAGRDQGREYVLVEGETTVGRGIDNEVILADVSVSRRHLQVVREGDVLVLRDLGSGNGTMVNGRRVASATLAEGDRIELGETVLVVRMPGPGIPSSTPDPEPVRAVEHTTDESMPPGPAPGYPRAPGQTPDGVWSLPPPALGPSLPPASTPPGWLPTSERTGTVVLDRRTLLLSAGGIAIGASVIGALVVAVVMRGAPSQPVASTLPIETTPVVVARPVTPPNVSVQPPIPTPVPAPAVPPPSVPSSPAVVPAPTPDPAPAAPPTAATQPADTPSPEAPSAGVTARPERREEPEPSRSRSRDHGRSTRTSRATGSSERGRGSDAALAAYRAGDFAAAARQARVGGQGSLATQIEQFATHYRAAQSAGRGSPQAISAIERAIALDNQIVRGGHYAARLRPQLVSAYLDSAQSAMRARPQDACRSVQLAQRQGDGGSRAASLARQCETQAAALVSQAAGLERSDVARARSLYRSVLPMVPSSSPSYTRARQRIDALARQQSVDEDE